MKNREEFVGFHRDFKNIHRSDVEVEVEREYLLADIARNSEIHRENRDEK